MKTGNVVIEKTQNHTMTVHEVMPDGRIECWWFEGSDLRKAVFEPERLVFVRD